MHPSELDLTGKKISRYSFKERLGKGKFSAVWLAHDLNSKRDVAIKVLAEASESSATFAQTRLSFDTDLQSLAALGQQWAVLTYYTSFTKRIRILDDGGIETSHSESSLPNPAIFPAFFIVVELADGGCLGKQYTEDVVKGDNGDRVYIGHFIEVCMALKAAHTRTKPIYHCDIKPQNLFWIKKKHGLPDRVKLGDFGIANAPQPRGAQAYMPPEAFDGGDKASDAKRDIYALGCTFYELLTGHVAFGLTQKDLTKVSNPNDIRKLFHANHQNAPRPNAMEKAPPNTVSVRFNALLKEMMAIKPEDRPDLEEIISRLQIEMPSPVNIEARIEKFELSFNPRYRSDYEINPTFRFAQGELVYFIFISMPERTDRKYKTLFALLDVYFDDTYSVCEVFGRYDFLIRVWSVSKEDKMRNFCKETVQSILGDSSRALHVMHCVKADYLGIQDAIPSTNLDIVKTRILLHQAQESTNSQMQIEATKALIKHRIFLRPLSRSVQGSRVKCFCLIKNQDEVHSGDRGVREDYIQHKLEITFKDAKRMNLSVYMKALEPFAGFENEPSDYIVTYVANNFDEAIAVPAAILEKFHDLRIQAATLLATKRYYVESDRMANQ